MLGAHGSPVYADPATCISMIEPVLENDRPISTTLADVTCVTTRPIAAFSVFRRAIGPPLGVIGVQSGPL